MYYDRIAEVGKRSVKERLDGKDRRGHCSCVQINGKRNMQYLYGTGDAIIGDSIVLKFEKARSALEESLKRVEDIVPQAIGCQVFVIVNELQRTIFTHDPLENQVGDDVIALLQQDRNFNDGGDNNASYWLTCSRLAARCNEKDFELEIKSADNRILEEQLKNKNRELPVRRPCEAPTPGSTWAITSCGLQAPICRQFWPTNDAKFASYLPNTIGGQPVTPGDGNLDVMSPTIGAGCMDVCWPYYDPEFENLTERINGPRLA
ncbi:hypothetical protein Syun_025713 [Stephania yunnanensis]|uniref:Uncharacterized protein n=1 Tax=Stephania yunnanensis TaxID=152371 RepID=A0AAP0HRI5_9MAGN